jgi:hypothetical protein
MRKDLDELLTIFNFRLEGDVAPCPGFVHAASTGRAADGVFNFRMSITTFSNIFPPQFLEYAMHA